MTFNKILKKTNSIHGWLTNREAKALFEIARRTKGRGCVVEIGSWQGKSTVWIAEGLMRSVNRRNFYAIDPHTGAPEQQRRYGDVWTYDKFIENIKSADVADRVTPLIKTSSEAAEEVKEDVEMIFIDGSHSYEMVLLDFALWFPKVVDGGYMAFHDTNGRFGPTQVVKKLVYFSRFFKDIRSYDSLTIAVKSKNITKSQYALNILYWYKHFVMNILPARFTYWRKRIKLYLKKIIVS